MQHRSKCRGLAQIRALVYSHGVVYVNPLVAQGSLDLFDHHLHVSHWPIEAPSKGAKAGGFKTFRCAQVIPSSNLLLMRIRGPRVDG